MKGKLPVITINTYGGSLLLAAKAAGHKVLMSLEDIGYGVDIQRLNFPDLKIILRRPWPEPEVKGFHNVIILAHPPCSPFSVQATCSKKSKGIDAAAFQCTINVMEYALKNKCAALLLESVPGALTGAETIHKDYAYNMGYLLFRILLNANTFGLPQNRKRFWAVFVRQDLLLEGVIRLVHVPRTRTIAQVLAKTGKKTAPENLTQFTEFQKDLMKAQGINRSAIKNIMSSENDFGKIFTILKRRGFPGTQLDLVNKYCHPQGGKKRFAKMKQFVSTVCFVLNLNGRTGVLLSDSWWVTGGKVISVEDYCAIMGFPRNYKWGKYLKRFREFLSRGVCPPIAAWLLREVQENLNRNRLLDSYKKGQHRIEAGEVFELQPADKI